MKNDLSTRVYKSSKQYVDQLQRLLELSKTKEDKTLFIAILEALSLAKTAEQNIRTLRDSRLEPTSDI